MSLRIAFDFYFGGLAVFILSAFILLSAIARGINYQCRSTQDLLVFRPPLALRLWMIMLVLWLITCSLLQVVNNLDVMGNLFVLLPVATGTGGFMILLASRRSELRLDLGQRTYRFTERTLFQSQVHSGPWQDFAGAFVRISRTRSGDMCHVGLAWQNEQANTAYLGIYGNRMKAQTFAMEVAEKLDLPIVPAPEMNRSRSLLG